MGIRARIVERAERTAHDRHPKRQLLGHEATQPIRQLRNVGFAVAQHAQREHLPGVAEVSLELDVEVFGRTGRYEQAAVMCAVNRFDRDLFIGMAQHMGKPIRGLGHRLGISQVPVLGDR